MSDQPTNVQSNDPIIADKDEEVTDETTGLTYKVVAGQPLPAHLVAMRQREEDAAAAKAQRAPDKDKSQTASRSK